MFLELLKFEWRYHARKPVFFLAVAAFMFFGAMLSLNGMRLPVVHMNSPYMIGYNLGILSMGIIFIVTIFGASGLLRDVDYKMQEMIYASPVDKFNYLFSRFVGVFLISLLAFGGGALGILVSSFMPGLDIADLGPMTFGKYIWHFLVLGVPNVLLCVSIIFTLAILTRNKIAIYIGGLFVYVLYVMGSAYSNAPWFANATPATAEAMALAAKLDPLGISAYFEQTRYWTAEERNANLTSLEGNFLFNRVFWTALALLLWLGVYQLFSFRTIRQKVKKQKKQNLETTPVLVYQPQPVKTDTSSYRWRTFLTLVKIELSTIIRSLPFLILMLLWIIVVGSEIFNAVSETARSPATYPLTGRIIAYIMDAIPFFGILVILFYSSEQIWRNRSLQFDELENTTPVKNLIVFLAKYFTLAIIPMLLILMSIVIGIIIQISKGYFDFEIPLYLSLFYYSGLPFLLIAVLALCLQSLVPHKYLGLTLTALVLLFFSSRLGGLVGIRHTLLRFAQPLLEVEYSYMNGFGAYAQAFNWRMLYWSALAGCLALLTYGLWQRGKTTKLSERFRLLNYHLGKQGLFLLLLFFILFIGSGSYIFYQTNILNVYTTSEQRENWRQEYELKYKQFETLTQPTIIDVIAHVDLFPKENRYTVKGQYKIENQSNRPIDSVLIFLSQVSNLESVAIVNAEIVESDEHFGHYWLKFTKPLEADATTSMDFEFSSQWSGFSGHTPFNSIIDNGSFMRISRYFPVFGYQEALELSNTETRRRRKLPVQGNDVVSLEEWQREREDSVAYTYPFINFETVVSTHEDQVVVAPGNLIKNWTEHNRNYFHYKMDRPIPFRFAFASADFSIKKEHYRGIDVELYYHPRHDFNIDYMLQSIKNAFDYCIDEFGLYPYTHFRFVEVSQFTQGFAATAYPNTIFTIENWGFIADLRYRKHRMVQELIAHELSHQWWGGQIRPENIEGATVLTETLAQYTEFMVLEKALGKHHVVQGLNTEMDLYLSQRGFEKENPLHRVNFQPHVAYNKGSKIMYALKDLIGEEAINLALRHLIRDFAYPKTPPSTDDLLQALYRVSATEYHELINDWMKKIIVYDLKMEAVDIQPLKDGRYQLNLKIHTKKIEDDGWGKETLMPINEKFTIGVFTGHPNRSFNQENILYLEKHHFSQETTSLSITVDQKPAYVGIDPYIVMIDKDRMDNSVKVEVASGE